MSFVVRSDILVVVLLAYLGAVNILRYRRVKEKHRLFQYKSLTNITLDEAHKIQLYLFELEFPFIAQKALEFALFSLEKWNLTAGRTYAIPTISSLLCATRQFSTKATASKRMADTVVLILEYIGQPPGSARSTAAIARMNYIHSLYLKTGKIINEDQLYTLGLFLLEPIRWINKHEWRTLTDQEMAAMGLFWEKVGVAMRINYDSLPSAKTGWKDGLHFMQEIEEWSLDYEKRKMVPAQSNKDTADHTVNLLLYSVPPSLKGFGLNVVSALLDHRLRRAMLYDDPPHAIQKLVDIMLWSRKMVLRYLSVPRLYSNRKQFLSETPNGRIHRVIWDAEPWYMKATFMNRWLAIQSWIDWFAGRPIPGDEGDKYKPEGFQAHEIGPEKMEGKGLSGREKEEEWVRLVMSGNSTIGSF